MPNAPETLDAMFCVGLQAELEDQILQLLSSATGSLLDNIQLINTLDASKTTWEQVNQSLQVHTVSLILAGLLLD